MEQAQILNRYKPLFTRGRGGFGDVQVALDTRLQRRVAIKKLPLKNFGEIGAGIEEARTAALLSNPNIVTVYDFETTGLEALIIMENVDGPTLTELMAASSELLDIDTVTAILDGIVAALEFAHENQVLHLDIKPANVLINHSGHIKVSDFGLAELAGEAGFGEPQGGTIGYMPPEQLESEQVDTRTDLWALAALAYQLLTGNNPFFGLSAAASLAHIVDEPLILPSALREELGEGVDQALVTALDGDISQRQPSVAAFWGQLHPALGKVAPGRRALKRLVAAWAEREKDGMIAPGIDGADDVAEEPGQDNRRGGQWSPADSDDATGDQWPNAEPTSSQGDQWSPLQSNDSERQQRQPRQPREPRIPFWSRSSKGVRTFLARLIAGLGCGSMAWLGLSGVAYLSGSVATAATTLATSTSSPVYAESEFSLIIRIVLTAAIAVGGFLAPSLGAILAVLALCAGIFFTGNWLVGILVLAACMAWWVFIGRHNVADATVFCLTPLLTTLMVPMLVPLLAGYFENWKRALGTALIAGVVSCLLMLVTVGYPGGIMAALLADPSTVLYGELPAGIGFDLLHGSLNLMQAPAGTQLLTPLVTMVLSPQFWAIVVSWVAAAGVMYLVSSRKSRAAYAAAALLAALVLAAGNVLVPILLTGGHSLLYLTIVVVQLTLSLVVCLVLAVGAVESQPFRFTESTRGKK
jgi:serine/threonine protein kinase